MVSTRLLPVEMTEFVADAYDKGVAAAKKAAFKQAVDKIESIKDDAVTAFKTVCCPTCAPIKTYWSGGGPETGPAPNIMNWPSVDPTTLPVPATFGFDNRTNIPAAADRGKNEYWNKPGGPGAPSGRRALDGAAWVSVAIGATAEIEVQFKGHGASFCITNASIEVDTPGLVNVTPTSFAANSAKMTIKGVAEGECTIKLMCQSKPIGWCHVAVYAKRICKIRLLRINLIDTDGTSLTSAAPFAAGEIATVKAMLDKNYAASAVEWDLTDGGVVTYSTTASIEEYYASMAQGMAPNSEILFSDMITQVPIRIETVRDVFYFEPVAFTGGTTDYRASGGVANGIPATECLVYPPIVSEFGLNIVAHELGHVLGLHHPDNAPYVVSQLPDNFRLPIITKDGWSKNTMYSDHNNMMGYGAWLADNYTTRYEQWKVIRANL